MNRQPTRSQLISLSIIIIILSAIPISLILIHQQQTLYQYASDNPPTASPSASPTASPSASPTASPSAYSNFDFNSDYKINIQDYELFRQALVNYLVNGVYQ